MSGSQEFLDAALFGTALAVGCGVPIALLVGLAAQFVARRSAPSRLRRAAMQTIPAATCDPGAAGDHPASFEGHEDEGRGVE